jgi:hypothetical protein
MFTGVQKRKILKIIIKNAKLFFKWLSFERKKGVSKKMFKDNFWKAAVKVAF